MVYVAKSVCKTTSKLQGIRYRVCKTVSRLVCSSMVFGPDLPYRQPAGKQESTDKQASGKQNNDSDDAYLEQSCEHGPGTFRDLDETCHS